MLFSHPFVNRHLGRFHFLTIINKVAVNLFHTFLWKRLFSPVWGSYLGMELLGERLILCLTSQEMYKLLTIAAALCFHCYGFLPNEWGSDDFERLTPGASKGALLLAPVGHNLVIRGTVRFRRKKIELETNVRASSIWLWQLVVGHTVNLPNFSFLIYKWGTPAC